MTTRSQRATLCCALAVCLPLATAAQSRGPQVALAQRQVERANAMELQAVVEGDAQRAARFFVDEAILLPPDGSIVRGRPAIARYWTPTPGTRIEHAETETVYFDVHGDQAILVGTYTLTTASAETTTFVGTFFMVWRRTGPDDWRIVVDSWTSRQDPG